jgi:hypothetical protein
MAMAQAKYILASPPTPRVEGSSLAASANTLYTSKACSTCHTKAQATRAAGSTRAGRGRTLPVQCIGFCAHPHNHKCRKMTEYPRSEPLQCACIACMNACHCEPEVVHFFQIPTTPMSFRSDGMTISFLRRLHIRCPCYRPCACRNVRVGMCVCVRVYLKASLSVCACFVFPSVRTSFVLGNLLVNRTGRDEGWRGFICRDMATRATLHCANYGMAPAGRSSSSGSSMLMTWTPRSSLCWRVRYTTPASTAETSRRLGRALGDARAADRRGAAGADRRERTMT